MFKRLSMDKRQLTVELEEPLLLPLEWLARAVAISLLGRYPVLAEVVVRSKDAETRVSREEADELARPTGGLDTVTREECWGPWLTRFVRKVQDADRLI